MCIFEKPYPLRLALVLAIAACDYDSVSVAPTTDSNLAESEQSPTIEGVGGDGDVQIVESFTSRLALEITTEDRLVPNKRITLRLEGVAVEDIDGGEVVAMLPTQASMAFVGADNHLYYPMGRKLCPSPADGICRR